MRRAVRQKNLIDKSNTLQNSSLYVFFTYGQQKSALLLIINREFYERELLESAAAFEQKVQAIQEQMLEVSRGRHLCKTRDNKQMAAPCLMHSFCKGIKTLKSQSLDVRSEALIFCLWQVPLSSRHIELFIMLFFKDTMCLDDL